jgi:hypothetical protein
MITGIINNSATIIVNVHIYKQGNMLYLTNDYSLLIKIGNY